MRQPTLSEPLIVSSWWKNRSGEAVRVRLLTYEGQNIVDLRTWWTGKDGVLHPGKGFACTVKHLPQLASAFAAAIRKADVLGLIRSSPDAANAEHGNTLPDKLRPQPVAPSRSGQGPFQGLFDEHRECTSDTR